MKQTYKAAALLLIFALVFFCFIVLKKFHINNLQENNLEPLIILSSLNTAKLGKTYELMAELYDVKDKKKINRYENISNLPLQAEALIYKGNELIGRELLSLFPFKNNGFIINLNIPQNFKADKIIVRASLASHYAETAITIGKEQALIVSPPTISELLNRKIYFNIAVTDSSNSEGIYKRAVYAKVSDSRKNILLDKVLFTDINGITKFKPEYVKLNNSLNIFSFKSGDSLQEFSINLSDLKRFSKGTNNLNYNTDDIKIRDNSKNNMILSVHSNNNFKKLYLDYNCWGSIFRTVEVFQRGCLLYSGDLINDSGLGVINLSKQALTDIPITIKLISFLNNEIIYDEIQILNINHLKENPSDADRLTLLAAALLSPHNRQNYTTKIYSNINVPGISFTERNLRTALRNKHFHIETSKPVSAP